VRVAVTALQHQENDGKDNNPIHHGTEFVEPHLPLLDVNVLTDHELQTLGNHSLEAEQS
jgi:hypothetical protein